MDITANLDGCFELQEDGLVDEDIPRLQAEILDLVLFEMDGLAGTRATHFEETVDDIVEIDLWGGVVGHCAMYEAACFVQCEVEDVRSVSIEVKCIQMRKFVGVGMVATGRSVELKKETRGEISSVRLILRVCRFFVCARDADGGCDLEKIETRCTLVERSFQPRKKRAAALLNTVGSIEPDCHRSTRPKCRGYTPVPTSQSS